MRNLLSRLLGGAPPTGKALRAAHEAAEKARLEAINRDPPPGNGWRLAPQDSEGKWTVWNGPRPVASFWDENEAAEWARRKNADPRPNPVQRDDGKYCVNCGSHETDESLKARGYVSCCPERYVIPETWHVSADRLATGHYHVWRPADGLPTITDDSWPEKAEAQRRADVLNLEAHIADNLAPRSPDGVNLDKAGWARAEFLNVPIPDGVRMVVGPRKSPDDGNWWTFDRSGPVRGYTRKTNARAAADRANNGPAT